ncbi:hypothetical protein [Demequina sp.]|uniref:hypothetical protein n=1 Tax=Demequina sp. TaxID=2050685 RepID=UPI0025BBA884|nr:hypothetical protein [Demequina sp.]
MNTAKRPTMRLAAIAAAALWLGACGLLPVATDDATPAPTQAVPTPSETPAAAGWVSSSGVGFDMDLPEGWNDHTARYSQLVPDTVLAAYFGTAPKIENEGEPFATVSAHAIVPTEYPRGEVFEDLDSWAADMTDPVMGPEGGIQTATGGAGWWGSVTGDIRGRLTTIHAIHIFHGNYELMVLVESYEGDEAAAEQFMEALQTVAFTAPEPVEGRRGAPVSDDGRWHSYCDTFSAAPQPDWAYTFSPNLDSAGWECPADYDYLGGWVDLSGDSDVHVTAHFATGLDEVQMRAGESVPSAVGETMTSPGGYELTLTENAALTTTSGGQMTRAVADVVSPEGDVIIEVAYFVPLGPGGTAVVIASARDGGEFDTVAVEALAASITAENP